MRRHLEDIYDLLLVHFGPRHWWPGDSPTEVIVGAILTQSVAWRNVEKAIANLKAAGLLDFGAIDRADPEAIARLIVPTRYFRQKAGRLKAFAAFLRERYAGSLDAMYRQELGELRRELLALPGIGPETADCILLYGGDKLVFVVDAYTRRICSRLGLAGEKATYHELQALFMEHLPADVPLYNEYHALIVAEGHHICLSQEPRCRSCPLREVCQYGRMKEELGG